MPDDARARLVGLSERGGASFLGLRTEPPDAVGYDPQRRLKVNLSRSELKEGAGLGCRRSLERKGGDVMLTLTQAAGAWSDAARGRLNSAALSTADCDIFPRIWSIRVRGVASLRQSSRQRQVAKRVLRRGITRLAELRAAGVTAATIGRMERDGEVFRLGRGLYQLPDAQLSPHHDLAQASKAVPKGIVCLVSALAFHELTDRIPRKIWMAIGPKDWAPSPAGRPLRVVRMTDALRTRDVETHDIEGVPVKVFGRARSIVDCFRYRRAVGLPIAVEALREALRAGKATPAEIARLAERDKVAATVRPYLEALTIDG